MLRKFDELANDLWPKREIAQDQDEPWKNNLRSGIDGVEGL
jgi:hypothetical protein